jgi:hypothetical protein
VVAVRPSSSPAAASPKAPVQTAAMVAPRRCARRSAAIKAADGSGTGGAAPVTTIRSAVASRRSEWPGVIRKPVEVRNGPGRSAQTA